MSVLLGAIADDFTGATDLANTLTGQGMRVIQINGVPKRKIEIGEAQAVVIALKTRTVPVEQAVSETLDALEWLRNLKTRQYFFKYCSTFDSTPKGNIGPVADALLDALNCDFALLCPAFPANGRTVRDGNLYVGDLLLSESSMRNHPLTPMQDSNLLRLMEAQSKYHCGSIPLSRVRAGADAIESEICQLKSSGIVYGIPDVERDEDLFSLGQAAADHRLITGGSGMAVGLPANFNARGLAGESAGAGLPEPDGRCLVLAGSCSSATREQIDAVPRSWSRRKLDIGAIAEGHLTAEVLSDWACQQDSTEPVLIYSSASPEDVELVQQRFGIGEAGRMIEQILGEVARDLVRKGFRRLIVAGGETSGAVVTALGIVGLRIGPEIDPGVPWTETLESEPLALALKSGNFGTTDFFAKAFSMLR